MRGASDFRRGRAVFRGRATGISTDTGIKTMRDILVLSQTAGSFGSEVDVAAQLGAVLHAQLTGLFVIEPYVAPPSYAPTIIGLLEQQASELRAQAIGAAEEFTRFAHKRGCRTAGWQVGNGPLLETVAQMACWHDMIVVPRDDAFPLGGVSTIGRLLLGLRMPTLVVPASHRGPLPFERVAIATNGSFESVRALRAAIPLIAAAASVVLFSSETHARSLVSAEPGAAVFSASAYLARHGFTVDERSLPAGVSGDELVDAAAEANADLLVMGAYSRSRVSERILGGATRSALERCPMALFMTH